MLYHVMLKKKFRARAIFKLNATPPFWRHLCCCTVQKRMDWRAVLSSGAEDVEKNEELLERLYSFFLQTDLPQQGS